MSATAKGSARVLAFSVGPAETKRDGNAPEPVINAALGSGDSARTQCENNADAAVVSESVAAESATEIGASVAGSGADADAHAEADADAEADAEADADAGSDAFSDAETEAEAVFIAKATASAKRAASLRRLLARLRAAFETMFAFSNAGPAGVAVVHDDASILCFDFPLQSPAQT
jgi:hypothetical protein